MLHYNQSKPKFLHTIRTNFFHCSDEDKLQMLVETLGEPIDNNTVRTANIIKKQLPNGQTVYAIYFNYSNYVMYPRFSIWAQSDVKSLPLTLIRRLYNINGKHLKGDKASDFDYYYRLYNKAGECVFDRFNADNAESVTWCDIEEEMFVALSRLINDDEYLVVHQIHNSDDRRIDIYRMFTPEDGYTYESGNWNNLLAYSDTVYNTIRADNVELATASDVESYRISPGIHTELYTASIKNAFCWNRECNALDMDKIDMWRTGSFHNSATLMVSYFNLLNDGVERCITVKDYGASFALEASEYKADKWSPIRNPLATTGNPFIKEIIRSAYTETELELIIHHYATTLGFFPAPPEDKTKKKGKKTKTVEAEINEEETSSDSEDVIAVETSDETGDFTVDA